MPGTSSPAGIPRWAWFSFDWPGGDSLTKAKMELRPELVEHLRVRLHEANQVFGLEDPERPHVRAGFREPFQFVRTRERRVQQDRLRVPGMTFDRARGRVVARNRQNVRFSPQQNRQRGVELLDGIPLAVEVSILAVHVRVFVMDEEKV